MSWFFVLWMYLWGAGLTYRYLDNPAALAWTKHRYWHIIALAILWPIMWPVCFVAEIIGEWNDH